MDLKQIIPRKKVGKSVPLHRGEHDAFLTLRDEMNRLFDGVFSDWEPGFLEHRHPFSPSMDVNEDEHKITVSTELPGMDRNQIEVTFEKDILTIRGEKREEDEERDKNYYRMERKYGSFQRSIRLPDSADAEKAEASFSNGVLKVVVPKKEEEMKKRKKIEINQQDPGP